jgi:hypothetical protein
VKEINYNPKTRSVAVSSLKVGDVVMESDEHPATITHIYARHGRVQIRARYIWQDEREPDWVLASLYPYNKIKKAR